jgi:hypothetical protein
VNNPPLDPDSPLAHALARYGKAAGFIPAK